MLAAEQQVLCLPRNKVPDFCGFVETNLLSYAWSNWILSVLLSVPRSQAETDESFKQLVCYGLVTDGHGRYLVYERPAGHGDHRLHGLWAIGIGGHVETSDHVKTSLYYTLQNAACRELEGEVGPGAVFMGGSGKPELLGFVQHDDTPVARVHLGAVFLCRIDHTKAKYSAELLRPEWMTLADLQEAIPQMEYWSAVMTRWLIGASRRNLPCILRHQSTDAVIEQIPE